MLHGSDEDQGTRGGREGQPAETKQNHTASSSSFSSSFSSSLASESRSTAVWRVFRSFGVEQFCRFLRKKQEEQRLCPEQEKTADDIFRESIEEEFGEAESAPLLFEDLSLKHLTGVSSVSSSNSRTLLYGEEARCFELSFFFFLSLLLSLSSASSNSSVVASALSPCYGKTGRSGQKGIGRRLRTERKRGGEGEQIEEEQGEEEDDDVEEEEEGDDQGVEELWRELEEKKVLLDACEAALSFFPRNRFFLGVYIQVNKHSERNISWNKTAQADRVRSVSSVSPQRASSHSPFSRARLVFSSPGH